MRPWPSSALLIPAALACGLAAGIPALAARQSSAPLTPLPNGAGSFKFAVLGDSGTGEKGQHELAEQMASLRERFEYRTVLLLGGNIAGPERPQDFLSKFEVPYKRLLDQGVEFRAALGESDSREQRFYKLFNMGGQIYYTFSPMPDIQFFALETTYMEPAQMRWLESQLKASSSAWKIVFFHHSPYSSGRRHGSDVRLRNMLTTSAWFSAPTTTSTNGSPRSRESRISLSAPAGRSGRGTSIERADRARPGSTGTSPFLRRRSRPTK
jgi:hypothetical protein